MQGGEGMNIPKKEDKIGSESKKGRKNEKEIVRSEKTAEVKGSE